MIKVTQYLRRPRPLGNFSIESLFENVRALAPENIQIKPYTSRYFSNGIFKRICIIIEAYFHQGDVNHITGDIHFIAILLKKSKTILTILDCGQLKVKSGLSFKLLKYFWFSLPCKRVSLITVISEYTKQDLLRYVDIPENKIKVIPVFVSDKFKRTDKPFNKELPVLLQIGTAHNKNIDRTIKAIENIPCHFKILGRLSTDQIILLKNCRIKYTHIDRSLTEEELYNLYKSADLVTFMSTLEGFGMNIIEANQMGIPVISSNVTSIPWVAGNAAHLVDPLDIEEMHNGILKIINDTFYREELIARGLENCKRFDRNKIAKQYFDLYLLLN